jgi:transposase-like protein
VFGLVGRESGAVRLAVTQHSDRATLDLLVQRHSRADATVNTDEWTAYDQLPASGRTHVSVKHGRPSPEYARDDDGDGVREVHCNTMEGIWTGLRNRLRTFRGVSKKYLGGYVAMFQGSHNLKIATDAFLRILLIVVPPASTIAVRGASPFNGIGSRRRCQGQLGTC